MKAIFLKIILRDLTRMFALVIGISQYSDGSPRDLPAAIKDVFSMKNLLSKARVHEPRCLIDQGATTSAIRHELERIATDDAIEKDDPILIYFAGHGAKDEDIPGAHVLCPYDFNRMKDGIPIHKGISDAELASFINVIASKKGNNIVSIFNLCPRTTLLTIVILKDSHFGLLLLRGYNSARI